MRLTRTPEYAECPSWVQLVPLRRPSLAQPVRGEAALAEITARVRDAVG